MTKEKDTLDGLSTEQIQEDLTLMLIFFGSWQEESRVNSGETIYKAWKHFSHNILELLEEKKNIKKRLSKSKVVVLTEQGRKRAKEMLERYIKGVM